MAAAGADVEPHLKQRLGLSKAKLATVARGVAALGDMADPVAETELHSTGLWHRPSRE